MTTHGVRPAAVRTNHAAHACHAVQAAHEARAAWLSSRGRTSLALAATGLLTTVSLLVGAIILMTDLAADPSFAAPASLPPYQPWLADAAAFALLLVGVNLTVLLPLGLVWALALRLHEAVLVRRIPVGAPPAAATLVLPPATETLLAWSSLLSGLGYLLVALVLLSTILRQSAPAAIAAPARAVEFALVTVLFAFAPAHVAHQRALADRSLLPRPRDGAAHRLRQVPDPGDEPV